MELDFWKTTETHTRIYMHTLSDTIHLQHILWTAIAIWYYFYF